MSPSKIMLLLILLATGVGNADKIPCKDPKINVYYEDYEDVVIVYRDSVAIDTLFWIQDTTITFKPHDYCKKGYKR